jgi:hypothetical protein
MSLHNKCYLRQYFRQARNWMPPESPYIEAGLGKIMKSRRKKPTGGKIRIRKGIELTKYELNKFRVSEKDTVTRPSDDLQFSGEPSG